MTDHGTLTGLGDDDHPQYLLKSLVDAKGDLYVASADNVLGRLPIGTNGQVLTADSAQTLGVKWSTPTSWLSSDLVVVDKAVAASALTFTTITASATPHAKGTFQDVIAVTSGAATMMRVKLANSSLSGSPSGLLLDIAVGATPASDGSNNVVTDLNAGYLATSLGVVAPEFWFPVSIAAGARVSARCQATRVSGPVDIHITLFNGTNRVATAIETLGAVSASSRGPIVTSSGTGNTKGVWQTIIASTANAYTGLLVAVGGGGTTSYGTGVQGVLDIGTGANPSEVVLPNYADLVLSYTNAETVAFQTVLPVYNVSIAAGTRIAARWAHAGSGAELIDVICYGLR